MPRQISAMKRKWVATPRWALVVAVGLGLSSAMALAADRSARETAEASITAEELHAYVATLASERFEGREAGSRGGRAAGDYLLGQLRRLGIAGAAAHRQWEQPFQGEERQAHGQVSHPLCRNLLGQIEGTDPNRKHEYLLIGAHYDHVGYGNKHNSRGPWGQIHPGADDNASGTAVLLELAEALRRQPPPCSVLLAFWDGEEKEMLGSLHWVAQPTIPLSQVVAAINIDMVGRLRDQHLIVYGTRTARGLRRLVSQANVASQLDLEFNWDLEDDSDHYPFWSHQIPSLYFYTGDEDDSHSPRDTVEEINHEGMATIGRLLFRVVHGLAQGKPLPSFRQESLAENEKVRQQQEGGLLDKPETPSNDGPVRLASHETPIQDAEAQGFRWRMDDAEPGTVVLTHIAAGSPAARAGLRVGDRIYHDLPSENVFRRYLQSHDALPGTFAIERHGRFLPAPTGESGTRESAAGLP